jgi:hypothetical protein
MRWPKAGCCSRKAAPKDALKLLSEADAVLCQTDDYITRGNIQSSYGRMYRREGRYDLALRHFARPSKNTASATPSTAIWPVRWPIWGTSSA